MATWNLLKRLLEVLFCSIKRLRMATLAIESSPQVDQINAHLTEDCLAHIFYRLPIHDLISVRSICRRWKSVQELATRERKILRINGKSNDPSWVDATELSVSQLDSEKVQSLLRTFPNISILRIEFCEVDTAELTTLLDNWPQLKCLTLQHFTVSSWEPLWTTLNRMPLLRTLNLLDMELFDYSALSNCDLSVIFKQLNSFTLDESMSEEVFDFVSRLSADKKRKLYFTISTHYFEVMADDSEAIGRIKETFESVSSIYRIFEDLIPMDARSTTARGILSSIPAVFRFDVI